MARCIVFMCMHGESQIRVLLPIMEGLWSRGATVILFTHVDFRRFAEAAGARFVDLYADCPLDEADSVSIPLPTRFVSFAGVFGERLSTRVGKLKPDLIIHDTFTVVGSVVARLLGLPHVSVVASHAQVPKTVLAEMANNSRVRTSKDCLRAVERLRSVFGMRQASPFCYLDNLSPYLNLYAEPQEFLSKDETCAFEPVEFFGMLPATPRRDIEHKYFTQGNARTRLYLSFGTVVWLYFPIQATQAVQTVIDTLSRTGFEIVVSFAGHLKPSLSITPGPGVQIHNRVDQWSILGEADLFLTQNGVNSTHEAIYHEVPMLSYPFLGDQPALARRCETLGLARVLNPIPRTPIKPNKLLDAVDLLWSRLDEMRSCLAKARNWELRTLEDRPRIVQRLIELARGQI